MNWFLYCVMAWTLVEPVRNDYSWVGNMTCLVPKLDVWPDADVYRDKMHRNLCIDLHGEAAASERCNVTVDCRALATGEGLRRLERLGRNYMEPPHCVAESEFIRADIDD
jgi:hypothetical protein